MILGVLYWLLMAYLVWRAWPSVRGDLRVVRSNLPARRGRYRGGVL